MVFKILSFAWVTFKIKLIQRFAGFPLEKVRSSSQYSLPLFEDLIERVIYAEKDEKEKNSRKESRYTDKAKPTASAAQPAPIGQETIPSQ